MCIRDSSRVNESDNYMNELPSKPQDVVIIGAGFVGIATAMWLQKVAIKSR